MRAKAFPRKSVWASRPTCEVQRGLLQEGGRKGLSGYENQPEKSLRSPLEVSYFTSSCRIFFFFLSRSPSSYPTSSLCKKDGEEAMAQLGLHGDLATLSLAQAHPHTLTLTRAGSP